MFDIQVVSFTAADAPASFERSLRETGFAVLTDHPITADRIAAAYRAWADVFASEDKHRFLRDPDRQDGYFPYRSENAKDHPVKDLKEFFHVYPDGRLPETAAEVTRALYADLVDLGQILLGWIEDHADPAVRDGFSEPLTHMVAGSTENLLRILHYPALPDGVETGAVRAAEHGDINLITLLVAGTEPGLEARDTGGGWHRVPCDPGMMVINAGDMLQLASGGTYPSTPHRVMNPPAGHNVARYSMPMFLHPRPEVRLAAGKTAQAYLLERLREIGLKS
ncbi:MAG: isopenicillin N synthase family oxygenase [Alphaproteobacteria bacterium]|nr:isopenicillin N synthase family oxygenase [Alphaproteobacteria bacterium]